MLKNNKFCVNKAKITQSIVQLFFVLMLVQFLNACGKGEEVTAEPGTTQSAADGTTINIKLVDAQNNLVRNLDASATARVVVTLKNPDNEVIAGEVIEYSSNLGTLALGTGLTENNGRSTVGFSAGTVQGAGKITAKANLPIGELSVSYGFMVEGTVAGQPDTGGPKTDPEPGNVSASHNGVMEFVSATPNRIALKSTGGAGLSELSVVTFKLVGTDGLPLANQTVNFSINNSIGGINIEPASAVTGFDGVVSTSVHSGTVPTSVRITAEASIVDGAETNIVSTQSANLAVGVGMPDQNSMSLSLSTFAPEAWSYDGEEVDVTIRLGDHFNNFVPDGTTVYFTTEGGVIDPSCETVDSACSVKWVSSDPRPSDHRVTILATTLGSESFQDTDSDGVYSLNDGEPFTDSNYNGIYDESFTELPAMLNGRFDEPFLAIGNGRYDFGEEFVDLPNGIYDLGEDFVDVGNGIWDVGEDFTDTGNPGWDGEPFVDLGNGVWNVGETFTDVGNGRYDSNESFTDLPDNKYDVGDIFIDYNGNGVFDGDRLVPAGETVFLDTNGNQTYDGSGNLPEGELAFIFDKNNNGAFEGPGFADLGEPFLDANENLKRDEDEHYVDTNRNGQYDFQGDGLFNGVPCKSGEAVCSPEKTVRISASTTLVMASSQPRVAIINNESGEVYLSTISGVIANSTLGYIDARLGVANISVYYGDSATQLLPSGTEVSVTADTGKISGEPNGALPNYAPHRLPRFSTPEASERMGNQINSFSFIVSDSNDNSEESGVLEIKFTTPKGIVTSYAIEVRT